jgi:hypothetical protein
MRMATPVLLGLMAVACDRSPTTPGAPHTSRLTIDSAAPASGGAVVVPAQLAYIVPGGVVLPRGSGLVSVRVTMATAHEVPWARLNVYLLTGGSDTEYCGMNDPDAPTWSFLPAGWSTTYTVSGFRVYRLPCEVTGIRAMLHMRNNGLFAPPSPGETIAEATLPSRLQIRR